MQISARIAAAGRAGAVLVQRPGVLGVACVLHVDDRAPREDLAGPARSRRQDAIHHVDSAFDGPHDVVRLANAHQVARLVLRQLPRRMIKACEHRLLPLAHGQAPHGIAVEADRLQILGAPRAQVPLQPPLLNPENRVARPVPERLPRPLGPPHGKPH